MIYTACPLRDSPDMLSRVVSPGRKASPLAVLLLYENFAVAKAGKVVCDRFASEMGSDLDVQLNVWKFDFLKSPLVARAATLQARDANLVVIAVNKSENVPAALQSWLEGLAPLRGHNSGAMVAVVGERGAAEPAASPLGLTLKAAAARTRRDFFCVASEPGTIQLASAPSPA